jgi:putative redox protein
VSTESVRAEWVGEQLFLLQDRNGFPLVMAQPNGVLGADLLPLSLIGCAAWDVVAILRKQRLALTLCEVTAESEREAEPPWRFQSICIRYKLGGRGLDEAKVHKAIALTEEKYCSIYATLRRAIELTHEVEIVEM